MRMCRAMEPFNLVWIEEPLDAYDYLGHAELARVIDTPIATGEMLASVAEHVKLIEHQSCDIIQPDARGSAARLRLCSARSDRHSSGRPAASTA